MRRRARSDSSGFTLVELVVAMALTLVVVALLPRILETTMTATSSAQGTATGAAQAELAIQNLDAQVASASQVCLPTQLTDPTSGTPVTVTSGFALRVEQVESATTDQWEQWEVNTSSGLLQEERYTPQQAGGGWVTVAKTIYNSTVVPFTEPSVTAGSPQEVLIDLQVSERPGRLSQKLEIKSAVSAFSTPYTLSPTPLCSSTSAEPTS
jgi:prepilin-type N-terminal cleavage/methylation domain-containing protein